MRYLKIETWLIVDSSSIRLGMRTAQAYRPKFSEAAAEEHVSPHYQRLGNRRAKLIVLLLRGALSASISILQSFRLRSGYKHICGFLQSSKHLRSNLQIILWALWTHRQSSGPQCRERTIDRLQHQSCPPSPIRQVPIG